jgi:PhnB protein
MVVNPYLNFNGNTEEAFNFYKSVFGGEFLTVMRMTDTPDSDKLSPDMKNLIMHIALPLGNGNIMMGTDATESMGFHLTFGNNQYLCVSPDSKEQSDTLFNALAEGGNVEMPLADMFWGAYYGSLTDKFGIKWMINFQTQQPPPQ